MTHFIDDDMDFAAYLKMTDAKTFVRPASLFIDQAKKYLRGRAGAKRVFLPWTKTNNDFEFRPGEVTCWAGQNGHGKTDITTQVALSLLGQDQRVCVASLEMRPITTIGRMVRMYSRENPFSPEFQDDAGLSAVDAIYDEFGGWSSNLWLYDQTKTGDPETILGMVKYCAAELKIQHIFVDSLMKCVRAEDDYNGQKDFVDNLCAIAKDNDTHVHLVHHLKKPANEHAMPDKHDTKGSGSITDQVDNMMMVWRNKRREEDLRNGKTNADCDSLILCRKQRNYMGTDDGEPSIALWRDKFSGQFVGALGDHPMLFNNYPHRATP
jgi:twinkle protein